MSRNLLREILDAKRAEAMQLRAQPHLRDDALRVRASAPTHRFRRALSDASRPHIIAEFKRRSPTAGVIRANASAAEIATMYERAGASALSVLTDAEFFGGSTADIADVRAVGQLPVLRKDFIVDAAQIYEAATIGADAVLLIVAALSVDSLGELRAVAEGELGMDALVEVHTREEMRVAAAAGATLIGVNNRDLTTFNVSLRTSEELIGDAPDGAVLVSESGLCSADEIARLHRIGYRGFLVGESLMRADDPEQALRALLGTTGKAAHAG